ARKRRSAIRYFQGTDGLMWKYVSRSRSLISILSPLVDLTGRPKNALVTLNNYRRSQIQTVAERACYWHSLCVEMLTFPFAAPDKTLLTSRVTLLCCSNSICGYMGSERMSRTAFSDMGKSPFL